MADGYARASHRPGICMAQTIGAARMAFGGGGSAQFGRNTHETGTDLQGDHRFLPDDAVVVSDTGHSGIWTGTMIELNKPEQRYIRCAGSLGWAFPASLGVKCALPEKPVLCFTGDGGFYYHLAELETAVRFGINAVIVVNNNRSLNQETRLFDAAYGGRQRGRAREMWVFEDINLAKVAAAMGCFAIRVERPGELRGALKQAFSANRPAVIDRE
jgi:acetolactate synthase I/II/III large subunit